MSETNNSEEQKKPASKVVCAILAIIPLTGGVLNLHRMLMGYKQWWIRMLICCIPIAIPIMTILAWVDAYNILTGKMKMKDGRDLE